MSTKRKSLNYYLLNKRILPDIPRGYRQSIINFVVNNNDTKNRNKHLFIQDKIGTWSLSRQSIIDQNVSQNLFETLVVNIGEELGLYGMVIHDLKPRFIQNAYFFNIARQDYDEKRAKAESLKQREVLGKIYHLAHMDYRGPDKFPIGGKDSKAIVMDYKWVDEKAGLELLRINYKVVEKNKNLSKATVDFQIAFYEKILQIHNLVKKVKQNNFSELQQKLL